MSELRRLTVSTRQAGAAGQRLFDHLGEHDRLEDIEISPASMREMSKMSLIRASRCSPAATMW